jgi:hypothetical protein
MKVETAWECWASSGTTPLIANILNPLNNQLQFSSVGMWKRPVVYRLLDSTWKPYNSTLTQFSQKFIRSDVDSKEK